MALSGKTKLRYILYCVLAVAIVYGPMSAAQDGLKVTPVELDFNFWFRAALSALLAILIYIAKGTEGRLKTVETKLHEFDQVSAERKQILTQYNGRFHFLENEVKEQANTLQMLERLILTNYHDKAETEKHRNRVEEQLRAIQSRLDSMARPFHRRQDDPTEPSNG